MLRVHDVFEAQAKRTPDAIAIVAGAETLTYRELDERANRLAHHLVAAGVGPDDLVAFCIERTAQPVIAILGILKAGAGYVPIDPGYPAERRTWIVEDSRARVAVTTRASAGLVSSETMIFIEDALAQPSPSGPPVLRQEPTLDNVAYVIYTSGSTGRPKGSVVTHRNVVRLMRATEEWCRSGPSDCWTIFHSFAFDFSVWELWGALFYGGRAVVVPFETSRDPAAMIELIQEHGVTVLSQTPSAWKQLQHALLGRPKQSLALRLVIFGGEALDVPSLAPWIERYGDQRPTLVNMYGITETTVHVTYRPISRSDVSCSRSVIGVPLSDLTLHVLDADMLELPVEVAGELYVGGAGLSRGYLGRASLTAERFVPDPFSTTPGGRLYRSGDVGRRLPNGEVEHLGRADFQVKIRGFRVELGEIERVLAQHPAVRDVIVVLQEGSASDDSPT